MLIFDFDGTLADSLDVLIAIANNDFKANITKAEVRRKGTTKLVAELKIPKILLPFLVWRIRRKIHGSLTKLHPHKDIVETISKLHKRHKLAIVTSNSKTNVLQFLVNHKMDGYFAIVDDSLAYFGKAKKIKKIISTFGYSPKDCFYIGDETRDIEAAKSAGVQSIAVTWGYESRKLLNKTGARYTIDNPKELLRLLR